MSLTSTESISAAMDLLQVSLLSSQDMEQKEGGKSLSCHHKTWSRKREERQAEKETCRTRNLKARLFCPQADGGQDSVHRQIL